MRRRDALVAAGAGALFAPFARASQPRNVAYPLREIQGSLTPADLFFVRDHFTEPDLSLETWSLRIDGKVQQPYSLNFSDLLELPSKTVGSVLECSGNAANGSAVGNAIWEGVPISYLLEHAGIQGDAAFLVLEGSDSGRLVQSSPLLPYTRLVPVQKCLDASSLIAFKLNDRFLPRSNGFPARALFPGWYGMDSVKWLRRISVLDAGERHAVYDQSGMDRVYNRIVLAANGPQPVRLSSIQVKSAVAWPADDASLPMGRHNVWGFAWSGVGAIRQVEVSVNGGRSWEPAVVESKPDSYQWSRWEFSWKAAAGDYVILSRATDSQGNQQPLERDKTRKDIYELNSCVPLRCRVR